MHLLLEGSVSMETKLQEKQYDQLPLGISGFGGWLIIVQVGLFATVILSLINLFRYSIPSFNAETWETLTSVQSSYYHPLWAPTIIFEAFIDGGIILYSLYIILNFYQKKSVVPRLMISFYSLSLLIAVIEYLFMLQIPDWKEADDGSSIRDIFKSILTCVIWIPYFLKSVRVRNTFVK
jgi:hypothetical protein